LLIIFDLDDTLIDTSGSLTPHKMENSLKAMMKEGLAIKNFNHDLEDLLAINAEAESSHTALENFLLSKNFPLTFLDIGLAALREELMPDDPISLVPYVKEMLEEIKGRHLMAIVSVGFPALQASKLKKAGIDPSLFSKIDIIAEKNKKPSYQALIDDAQLSCKEVIVCGDRGAIDLAPAQELGCHTVHLKRGRGAHVREKSFSSKAEFAIEDWKGFTKLLEQFETGHP